MSKRIPWTILPLLMFVCNGCGNPSRTDPIEELAAHIEHRLSFMSEVAQWKWVHGKPITDPDREAALIVEVQKLAEQYNLDPTLIRLFFEAQMAAARQVQEEYFEKWKNERVDAAPKDLTEIRRQLSEMNLPLIFAVGALTPLLDDPNVAERLSSTIKNRLRMATYSDEVQRCASGWLRR